MKLEARELAYGPPGGAPLKEGLSFSLAAGEALHVRGENGSGKSLLLRTLAGFLPARSGRIENEFPSFRYLTQTQSRTTHLPFALREIVGEGWETLLSLRHLGLAWNRASGGERQRALLSRCFGETGDLLLLDEPFNHLDRAAKDEAKALIGELLRKPGRALVLISHDDQPARWLPVPVRELDL